MDTISRRRLLEGAAVGVGGLAAMTVTAQAASADNVGSKPSAASTAPSAKTSGNDAEWGNFRFPMGAQKSKVYEGGSAQEATAAEFPISKGIAGVSMRLKPGGLRELHWHANASEWAYIISGHCRTTVFDPDGSSEVLDFAPGDIWYFPRGYGHSLLGIGSEECHFILSFDNGNFSEFATFSITDWIGHTPPEAVAKSLQVPASTFENFPKREVYIAQGAVPGPLPVVAPAGSEHVSPLTHRFRLMAQKATLSFPGGSFRLASVKEFPISTTMAGATLLLDPGAMRELHWHPNANEWQYYVKGRARMTVFGSTGRSSVVEFGPGDVGYVPQGFGHSIENIGDEECQAILTFDNGNYEEISISDWIAATPRQILATNFGVPESVFANFPDQDLFIAGGKG
jgi:oxalate decarboxylase